MPNLFVFIKDLKIWTALYPTDVLVLIPDCLANNRSAGSNVGLTAINKMVPKVVLKWSKLTLDYTKLKLQDQGPLLKGPSLFKMVQNRPKLNTK